MEDRQSEQRAEYCRKKALEARTKAEQMRDPEARRMMAQVAEMWEAMARAAARRAGPQ